MPSSLISLSIISSWLSTILPFIIFILIAIIVFYKFSKSAKKIASSGLVLSPRLYHLQPGEKIPMAEIFANMGLFGNLFNLPKLPSLMPEQIAQSEIKNGKYKIYKINLSIPSAPTIWQIFLSFSKYFPSHLVLHRVDGPSIGPDIDLESVEFNKKVLVKTDKPRTAWQILSPDFMDWYLKQKYMPIIFFEEHYCYCTIVSSRPISNQEIITMAEELADRIGHSGALGV